MYGELSMDKMLIFGGTGSLGKSLISHFIDEYEVYVFSRDEAKHVAVKQLFPKVRSLIGDVRDRDAVFNAILKVKPDIIINAAALKNVPEVEEVPMEGVKTSLMGNENITISTKQIGLKCKVLMVSTDKAAKPINSYGMAKALQERLHIRSNGDGMVCNAVRYGNVLESRGSLIPLLKQRLQLGEEVFITHKDMTRFFMTLNSSVELIKTALADDEGGKVFIPVIRSARIVDVVDVIREAYSGNPANVKFSQIRPGEKIDEVLICKEEFLRTEKVGNVFVIHDILSDKKFPAECAEEYTSGSSQSLLTREELVKFLAETGIINA
jgi:UDP-glucose 4-epimerase